MHVFWTADEDLSDGKRVIHQQVDIETAGVEPAPFVAVVGCLYKSGCAKRARGGLHRRSERHATQREGLIGTAGLRANDAGYHKSHCSGRPCCGVYTRPLHSDKRLSGVFPLSDLCGLRVL